MEDDRPAGEGGKGKRPPTLILRLHFLTHCDVYLLLRSGRLQELMPLLDDKKFYDDEQYRQDIRTHMVRRP